MPEARQDGQMTLERIAELREATERVRSLPEYVTRRLEWQQVLDLAEKSLTQPRPELPEALKNAAPDLLDALKAFEREASSWHEMHRDNDTTKCDSLCECLSAARAAIAKAEALQTTADVPPSPPEATAKELPEALKDIPGLLNLCAKATPPPWYRVADAVREPRWSFLSTVQGTSGRLLVADADFIAAARTALPAALEHIQAQQRPTLTHEQAMTLHWAANQSKRGFVRALEEAGISVLPDPPEPPILVVEVGPQ